MNENQDNTNDPTRATGMSAAERQVRADLHGKEATENEFTLVTIPVGVLRTLIRDLDMWRDIVTNDIDTWSFDGLMAMAKRILAEVYPEDVFTGKHANTPGNEGVTFVVALREVIKQIEARG